MDPLTLSLIIGGIAATTLGTGGAIIHGNNKLNKERAEHQEERNKLQKQIEGLLKKITEKDAIILSLQKRIKELDEEKLAETQKRHEMLQMIEKLEQRQEKLESLLTGLIAFLTFRFGKWNSDKIELRKCLEQSNNDKSIIDGLIIEIENKKASLETEFNRENDMRDQLSSERKKLSKEFEKMEECA